MAEKELQGQGGRGRQNQNLAGKRFGGNRSRLQKLAPNMKRSVLLFLLLATPAAFCAESVTKQFLHYVPKDTKVGQWAEPVMTLIHSLHGGGKDSVANRRQCLRNLLKDPSLKPWERGVILHAYGDAFAHVHGAGDKLQAYPYPNGHGFDSAIGNDPDLISNFPDRYKDYVKSLYQGLAGPRANADLLNKILYNATSLRGSHEKQNSAMAAFVQGPGFDYSTLAEPYKNFHPEAGKKLLPKDPSFPTPSAAEIQALMDKIRKACCGPKK